METGLELYSVKNGMRFEDPWHRMRRQVIRPAIRTSPSTAICSIITLGNWLDVHDVVGHIAFVSNKRLNQDPVGDSHGLTYCGLHVQESPHDEEQRERKAASVGM